MATTDPTPPLLPPASAKLFGADGKLNYVVLAKIVGTLLVALVTSIISAVSAYRSAASDNQLLEHRAKAEVQNTKNQAEAGYQVTREAMEKLEARVLHLEQGAARKAAKPGARRPAPPPPPPAVKALPSDLEKAERQVYKGGSSAGAAAAQVDGGQPAKPIAP